MKSLLGNRWIYPTQYLHIVHLCHGKVSSHIVLKLDADIKVYKYFSFKVYIIFISKASKMNE